MWPFSRNTDKIVGAINVTANEQRSISSPEDWLSALLGASPASAGIPVNATSAMRCAPVRAAVQAISETCATLPLALIETAPDGSNRPRPDHPAHHLLNQSANPWTAAVEFREELVRDVLLHGNGLALVVRDGSGTPRELHRLQPGSMTIHRGADGGPEYRQADGLVLGRDNVVHMKGRLGPDGLTGVAVIDDAKEAISLCLALERYSALLFANGARPSGILSFPGKLSPDAAKKMAASWKAATAGTNSAGTAVLEEDGKFTPLAFSSVDAQFAELRAFQIAEIARHFRVNPVLLQDLGRATWANASELGRQFIGYTLQPWLLRIEGELALKLLTTEQQASLVFQHDTDALTTADVATRATAYSAFRASGIYTSNELRRLENLPAMPGGDDLTSPHVQSGQAGGSHD